MVEDSPSGDVVTRRRIALTVVAWCVVVAVSALPLVLFAEIGRVAPAWLPFAQLLLLAAGIVACLAIPVLRPLWHTFAVFAVVLGGGWLIGLGRDRVEVGMPASGIPFVDQMLAVQVPRLALALVVVAASLVLFRGRHGFFFAIGDPSATAAPIRWIGLTKPTPWRRLGPIAALCLAAGVVVFIVIAGGAPLANLAAAVPLLPFVVLFAAANAFGEEIVYRAPQLAALERAVGGSQALLMTAAYFGIAHFYGIPYGIVGVVMATALGWVLGRSMLETRGMLWAWAIHFAMDVVVFTFLAAGSVTPGG